MKTKKASITFVLEDQTNGGIQIKVSKYKNIEKRHMSVLSQFTRDKYKELCQKQKKQN